MRSSTTVSVLIAILRAMLPTSFCTNGEIKIATDTTKINTNAGCSLIKLDTSHYPYCVLDLLDCPPNVRKTILNSPYNSSFHALCGVPPVC